MKINNKLVFIVTILILVLVVGWKLYKDDDSIMKTEEENSLIENTLINENLSYINKSNTTNINEVENIEVEANESKKNVIDITNNNFQEFVLESDKIVIVDFWAVWCGPCTYMSPILEEIANQRDDIIIAKVNVDEEIELSNKYNITRIPTMLIFKDGKMKKELIGVMSKDKMLQYIDDIK